MLDQTLTRIFVSKDILCHYRYRTSQVRNASFTITRICECSLASKISSTPGQEGEYLTSHLTSSCAFTDVLLFIPFRSCSPLKKMIFSILTQGEFDSASLHKYTCTFNSIWRLMDLLPCRLKIQRLVSCYVLQDSFCQALPSKAANSPGLFTLKIQIMIWRASTFLRGAIWGWGSIATKT